MAMTVADYRDAMLSLLPQGDAWPRDAGSEWGRLFLALSYEYQRVGQTADTLLAEMLPSQTVDMLAEWEADYGLPGGCIHTEQTFGERRAALRSKHRLIGSQSRQFFIDAALDLGYTITITEYNAANPGPQTEYQGIPLSGDDWNFVWQINAPDTTVQPRRYGSLYNEPYASFGNELLECTLRSLAHDHRALFFSYGA